ncbi:glycoside hydrolase family 38 C-terminal domain-containing protein [Micromonospora soli]|uniref:alpha-mannosidase n=1 Tax=Micromonospora sp. NBRC 110009 TaxID=3061627 RepID=UPI002673130C|nr:alpha-mannosidase [Micromonospora sp. NBRC 110009]WKT99190.1 glycoside hydrolase family 38 C-terminal domain-containing protein [Micromonospora sp. NBRC 110009]
MIGNAHIDAVWLWPWQEGYQEVRATFRAALQRIDEYPEFVFTCDSVGYLAWIEEHDPDLFAALREQVRAGRFEIVGGWWVEPDCNIPGGEGFVRHGLYSQRYLAEKFGRMASVGCNVDPFGQNAVIPQLLAKSGMDSYVFMRPQPQEAALPGPTFWWQAADGSRVLAYRIPHEYCSPGGHLGVHVGKALAQLPHTTDPLMCFYGVGNHGGGPTRANIESIRELDGSDQFPQMLFSTVRAFFDAARATGRDLPEFDGEIQPHAVGCYSAHSGIKKLIRQTEHALQAAEKWAAVASATTGLPPATDQFEHAWRQVLLNHFHDTAAGTALPSAYDDARDQLGEARSIAARLQNQAIQRISRQIDIPDEDQMTPLAVFNPHPWPVRTTVEVEFGSFLGNGGIVAEDDAQNRIPVQSARSTTVTGGRRRLVVPVELPPLGYRLYRMYPDHRTAPGAAVERDTVLENDHLRVVVDPATGWLSSLVDKATDAELISGDAARSGHAVVLNDPTDTWGHGVISYRDVIGAFTPMSVRRIETGPVRQVLRVRSAYGASTLTEDFVLAADARHVEVRVTIDWHERLRMLKLRFPTGLTDVTATHAVPYGHVERVADGHETVSHSWVDVTGTLGGRPAGLSVLNDARFGVDVTGGDIGLTALRSPAYAWHTPQPLPAADDDYEVMDQGVQRFTYRLLPHAGDWRAAGTVRAAAELDQPPVALLESCHDGPLPQQRCFAAVTDADNVVVTVVKQAEEQTGDYVVRGYETAGAAANATIDLPFLGRTITAEFGPHEIKTLLVPRDPARPPVEADLLERPTAAGAGPDEPDGERE